MEQIRHQGRVTQINGTQIEVEIISYSACQSCAAQGVCGLSECQHKKIAVETENPQDFELNEEVWVGLAEKAGFLAVWYSYIFPLILVLTGLAVMQILGYSEQISGIFSIILLIPYYFGLFLCQKRNPKPFRFTISKK